MPLSLPSHIDPLVVQAAQTIERHAMLVPGDRVLVGLSGGPDSVALTHILHALAPLYDLQLGVAHFDHGMRPEAAKKELALVLSLADQLNLTCHADKIGTIPLKGSLEEQLRHLRYAFFEKIAAACGYSKIALGHHADDNAEAVLMHLLRGSGIKGLSGIPPIRGNKYIRPLITVRRSSIVAYLERHGLNFAQDDSNKNLRFTRNKIRHHLIPLLQEQYNPNLIQTLNRLASLCYEEEKWLSLHLHPLLTKAEVQSATQALDLQINALLAEPRPVQRRLIRSALRQWQGDLRRIGMKHVDALMELVSGKPGKRQSLPGGVLAERKPDTLQFTRSSTPRVATANPPPLHFKHIIPSPRPLPFVLDIPEAGATLKFSSALAPEQKNWQTADESEIQLDLDQTIFPLTVRNFQPGDRLRPFGMQGTQKIKDLFINSKIPKNQRQRIPLLLSGDTIVWVVGIRRGNAAPISASTTTVLKVKAEAL